MQALKSEFKPGESLVTCVRIQNEAWLLALVDRWGWKETTVGENEEYQTYTMTL